MPVSKTKSLTKKFQIAGFTSLLLAFGSLVGAHTSDAYWMELGITTCLLLLLGSLLWSCAFIIYLLEKNHYGTPQKSQVASHRCHAVKTPIR